MRFYDIILRDHQEDGRGRERARWSSVVRGRTDPGALDVEFDIPVTSFGTPWGGGYVRVWGIGLPTLAQSSDFNGCDIEVFGGMEKGLPLALVMPPQQSRLLLRGRVQQAFGNWVGTDQTLDLVYTAGNWLQTDKINLTVLWRAGTPLAQAIDNTLRTAFPSYTRDIRISARLVLPSIQAGFYETVFELSRFLNELSRGIIRDARYQGVSVVLVDRTFVVTDGTVAAAPKRIRFTDLIGQVTWRGAFQISVQSVMRSDIQVGDFITLPPTLPQLATVTTPQSQSFVRPQSPFVGQWLVTGVRHTGRMRSPTAQAWVTNFEAVATQ